MAKLAFLCVAFAILCITLHSTSGLKGRQRVWGPDGKLGEGDSRENRFQSMQASISLLQKLVRQFHPINCKVLLELGSRSNGLYRLKVNDAAKAIQGYCDQTTDGGGWLVIQRRTDGSEDFYRNWEEYQRGFGNKSNEFWLGLDVIHAITNEGSYELRIDMEDFENETAYAKYNMFRVGPMSDYYRLEIGNYSGNAGDSLKYHNGQQFSTKDQDQDSLSTERCAVQFHGAWWYNGCHESNLNGKYLINEFDKRSPVWYYWRGWTSLKRVEMKIRPL